MYDIQTYRTDDDVQPYVAWLGALPDRQAKARIVVRVNRMAGGNLGDVKPVGDGVWEARIDYGPGYRLYYAQAGRRLILLLIGGDKRTQQSDITKAQDYWNNWQMQRKSK
ncbi:addiction module protein [Limnohabitans sp. Jir61]|uniref:type II toxin-antitoxin system RelE/ParE family toxin n=1 Tax=Limnohabitans sp. Jir61 TaxID=1826168 RepID=UPI000D362724|nr:type II toxin-antitoxin system RelE/ParE family toxin [Limnohabitans sp. Jir61]PUE30759.1 addiction module protein [Limnohabitans sp. Jir61]